MNNRIIVMVALAALFVGGSLIFAKFSYADPAYQASAQVTNLISGLPEGGATCTFTFNPSGNISTEITNASGSVQASDVTSYDKTVDVSCIGTDGNVGDVIGTPLSTQQASISVMLTKLTSPTFPQDLAVGTSAFGLGPVTLTWQVPSSDGGSPVRDYYIYRGNSPGTETFFASISGSVTSYMDNSTIPGSSYYYHVTAVNSAGESKPSNEVSTTISCFGDNGAFCN